MSSAGPCQRPRQIREELSFRLGLGGPSGGKGIFWSGRGSRAREQSYREEAPPPLVYTLDSVSLP